MPEVVLTPQENETAAGSFGTCGGFGKIASAGDFIRFGMSPQFVKIWDGWLQAGIAACRETLGGRWQDSYFSAPVWRFTVPAGLAGPTPALGVMMPSVDRVGRQFPLTLAVSVRTPQPLAELHFSNTNTFEAMEDIAFATLDELPLDDLKARCAALAPPVPGIAGPDISPAGVLRLDGVSDLAPALAAKSISQSSGQCLWSARLEDSVRLIRSTGLPQGGLFAALMDLENPHWQNRASQVAEEMLL